MMYDLRAVYMQVGRRSETILFLLLLTFYRDFFHGNT
jgi:hypothetical protein